MESFGMKLWGIGLLVLALAGCAQVNPIGPYHTGADDSNTVNSLSTVNPALSTYGGSAYPGQIYSSLAQEDANRWYEQGLPNLVSTKANASACLGVAGAGLTMTPTACVAYNAGYRGTDIHSITFANNATIWVAMDENVTGNNAGLPNFTRVASTHYLTDAIDATQPAMAFDSQLLMKVTTAGGSIVAVQDLRKLTAVTVPAGGLNPLNFGAVGNCTNRATGAGCSDDCPAFQAMEAAACPFDAASTSDSCTQAMLPTAGTFYFPNGCVLNPSAINAGSSPNFIGSPVLIGAGAAGGVPNTTILIGNGATIGIDMYGTAHPLIENIDIRTTTTNSTTKALVAGGKTTACDCDVPTFRNVTMENYSTVAIASLFLYGWEDATVDTSEFYNYLSGNPVVLSSANTVGGGITPTGVTMATAPVSMTTSYIHHSVLVTNATFSSSSPASACVYLDSPTSGSGIGEDGLGDSYCQLHGSHDSRISDGATGTRNGTIIGFHDNGKTDFLNNAGGGTALLYRIGENATSWQMAGNDSSAGVVHESGVDGVTNGTTSFTTSSGTCLVSGFSIIGAAIYVAGANGTVPGTYVTNCSGSSPATLTLSTAAQGGGTTGLTWSLTLAQASFYNALTNSDLNLDNAGTASLLCGNGTGTKVSGLSATYQQIPFCPGTTYFPQSSTAQVVSQPVNGGVGLLLRPYQDYGSPTGDLAQCTNAAGTLTTCVIDALGNSIFNAGTFNSTLAATGNFTGSAAISGKFFTGNGTASVSGGGSLATGSNSFAGRITGLAATSNILTPGFTCPNDVTATFQDDTTVGGVKVTAQSTTTVTFSATASDTADYLTGCR